jgi:flagellar protein FliO/FliZ
MNRPFTKYTAYAACTLLSTVAHASAEPVTQAVPAAAQAPMAGAGIVQVTLGLIAVVATIFAAAWLFRRMGGVQASARGQLRIVGGLSVGARERVVLVQVGSEQILLGVAPGRVESLHILAQPLELTEPTSPAPMVEAFAKRLSDAIKKRGGA